MIMKESIEFIKIQKENKFLIKKGTVYFSVSEELFLIISGKLKGDSCVQIANHLNKTKHTKIYNQEIVENILLNENVNNLIYKENTLPVNNKYIFFKTKILSPASIKDTLFFFSRLIFNKYCFFTLVILSIITTVFYAYSFYENLERNKLLFYNNLSGNIITLVMMYVVYILIIFLHELGHAASAIKYGVVPKQIGFGFYFTMPVLFTELTDVWRLPKRNKILINFSGIYLQLIINLLIIISLIFFPKNMLFNILFLTNSFSIIYALNPFFKNDGYWIFSDYFGIINLETKADKCFIQLFRGFVSPKKTFSFLKEKDIILVIYSVFSSFFWLYFLIKTTKYMAINAHDYYNSLITSLDFMIIVKVTLYIFFVFVFLKSTFYRIKSIIIS